MNSARALTIAAACPFLKSAENPASKPALRVAQTAPVSRFG
jgi:hypothetical protein